MTYFIIWLVINIVTAYDFTNLTCPHPGQWELRARAKNCSSVQNYVCLFDAAELAFDDKCIGPHEERKGNKLTLNKGNFDRIECSSTHYQPLQFFSFGNTNCTHLKSPCSEEGQVIADLNDTSYSDRSCRCDHLQGYAFVVNTSLPCSCIPSKEDCTCYLKTCSVYEVLSPDYKCINKTDSQGGHQCSFIILGTESTVPETGIVPVNKSDRVSLSNTRGNKSISACCIIVVVVIIVFIILCVCYWEQTDRKIRQFWKALKKIIVPQTLEEEEPIIPSNVDIQADIPDTFVKKDEDILSDFKDLKGKHTTCYSPEDLKKCIKQSLVESSKQHAVEERLKRHCKFHGMEFLGRTPGNGNCFFEAISAQIERLQLPRKSADDLRQEVSTYLQENPTYEANGEVVNLRDFVEVEDFMEYCESMSKNNVWADHVIVVTMARMLKQNIIIVTSSPETNQEDSLVWVHGGDECNEKCPLLIGHYWENHYQSLQPTGICKQIDVENCDEGGSVTFVHQVIVENIPGRSMKDGGELKSSEPRTIKSNGENQVPQSDDGVNNSCHIKERGSSSELTSKEVIITKQVEEQSCNEGESVTIACEVNQENIPGEWSKDGEELKPSDSISITAVGGIHELTIHRFSDEDRGYYSFKVMGKVSGGHLTLGLDSDENNFIKLCHFLKTEAEPAVRKIFDHEIHPVQLKRTLNQEKIKKKMQRLKRDKHINRQEYDLLYPRVVEYSIKFKIMKYEYNRIQQNLEEEKKLRNDIESAVSELYYSVEGTQKVKVVAIEPGSLIAVLKLTSSQFSDESMLQNTIESAVREGELGSFKTDLGGFTFKRLGNVRVPITSRNFDIRLMMILMKNLIEFNIADKLPYETDTTVLADLSRIKFIRNEISKNSYRSISDEKFEEYWSPLSQAIIRLSGNTSEDKCMGLKNYCPTSQQCLDYLHSNNLLSDPGNTSSESLTDDFVQETLLNNSARYAVRHIFDKQFPPQALQKEIEEQRQSLKNLKEQRGITQSQWDELFPREKETLSSARFDIKVMIILLSNTSFEDKEIFKTIENLQNCLSRPKEYRKVIMQAIKEINEEELSWR